MRTELTLAALALIALILLYSGISGGILLLMISLMTLSLIYLLGGFYFFSDRGIKRQKLWVSILSGVLLAHLPLALLFRLLSWQGARIMLTAGTLMGILATIFVLVMRAYNTDRELVTYFNRLAVRCVVLTMATLSLWLSWQVPYISRP